MVKKVLRSAEKFSEPFPLSPMFDVRTSCYDFIVRAFPGFTRYKPPPSCRINDEDHELTGRSILMNQLTRIMIALSVKSPAIILSKRSGVSEAKFGINGQDWRRIDKNWLKVGWDWLEWEAFIFHSQVGCCFAPPSCGQEICALLSCLTWVELLQLD